MKRKFKIDVIHEDENVLVINKPSGISVHGDGKTEEYTVADWILKEYPKLEKVGESWEFPEGKIILRPGIVHRLDKETSGVMVIAKTEPMYKFLKRQFEDREVAKVYRAVVHGTFKEKRGMIDRPIGRSGNDFRAKSVGQSARGEKRSAMTFYTVLGERGGLSYLEVRPKTGRTHQIRVHLKSIGKPVVCDKIYAISQKCPKEFGRLMLHAQSIEFNMPGGETAYFEAPLPKGFEVRQSQDKKETE